MTTLEWQQLSREDESRHRNSINEPFNSQDLHPRSIVSTETSIDDIYHSHKSIPPPAPSPPSSRIPQAPTPPQLHSRTPAQLISERSPAREHHFTMAQDNNQPYNQWIFTEKEIFNSPSVERHGLAYAEEGIRRAKGVNFIIQAGIILKLPQTTLGTAAVFFHRFYMRQSMVAEKGHGGIHHYNVAATALFLASKAEETCRKTKEIVIAVAKVALKKPDIIIDDSTKDFWLWKDNILQLESVMLEILTFDLSVDSPYNYLYSFLRRLGVDSNKPLRNVAWAFLNDNFMTTLCLLQTPRDIAVSALYFSAKFNKIALPDIDGESWWASLNGNPESIFQAIDVMTSFYSDNPLKKSENHYHDLLEITFSDLEETRLRAKSASPPESKVKDERDEEVEKKEGQINGQTNGESIEKSKIKSEEETRNGDDDAQLKRLANDPATHESTAKEVIPPPINGMNGAVPRSPLKRKDGGGREEESQAKRSRISVKDESREESEEGEVEE